MTVLSARLLSASTTVRPALARKAGGIVATSLAGATQSAVDPPCPDRTAMRFSVRPASAGHWAARRPQAAAPQRGCRGSFEVIKRAIGRASLPSWSRMAEAEPGGAVTSTKASTRPPGAIRNAPFRARKRFCRPTVESHHPHILTLEFDGNDSPLAAIDKAKPQALVEARREIEQFRAFHGIDGLRALGSLPVRSPCRRAQPPILDQEQLVPIDGDLPFRNHQRQRSGRQPRAIPQEADVAHEGAAIAQRNSKGFPAVWGYGRLGEQWLGGLRARYPPPIRTAGTGRPFSN